MGMLIVEIHTEDAIASEDEVLSDLTRTVGVRGVTVMSDATPRRFVCDPNPTRRPGHHASCTALG